MEEKSAQLTVLLTAEGTYPFHQGGVSVWTDVLTKGLDQVRFSIYSVMMNPFITQKFELREQTTLIRVPLWGTEEPGEHLPIPFSDIYEAKLRTSDEVISERFLPLFRQLIEEIIVPRKNPNRFASVLKDLYIYFREYEYKESFKSELVWDAFKETIVAYCERPGADMITPDVYSLQQSLGWIYRFLNIVNTPIPKTDVAHSSAAAFCGIPCVLSKLLYGTPYLLTEHGIYLREQYLSLSGKAYSPYLNTFLIRFLHSVVSLNYAFADQISPVCQYNTRWEMKLGANPEKIKVIYNGVDPKLFHDHGGRRNEHPTVVTVARIDPIKDLLMLIRAVHLVREQIPDIRLVIYGEVSVPEYYRRCLTLREELGLQEEVRFEGHKSNVSSLYHEGEIVVLSSISEGFPYSVVEAMMSGRPVIATDVGGVREALGDTGVLVPPKDERRMAEEMIRLLQSPERRAELGREARERALNHFTQDGMLEAYRMSYEMLALDQRNVAERNRARERQRLLVERGYSLMAYGMAEEAVVQLKLAVFEDPLSPLVPLVLSELAAAYYSLGNYDHALLELDKFDAYMRMLELKKVRSA